MPFIFIRPDLVITHFKCPEGALPHLARTGMCREYGFQGHESYTVGMNFHYLAS